MANSRRFTVSSTDAIVCGGTGVPHDADLCIVGLLTLSSSTTGVIISVTTASSGSGGWRLQCLTFTGTTVFLRFSKNGVDNITGSVELSTNAIYAFAIRVDEDTDVTFLTKPAGGSWTSEVVGDTSAFIAATSPITVIGNYPDNGTSAFGGDIEFPGVYSGLLSVATLEAIGDALLNCNTAPALASSPGILMGFAGSSPEVDLSGNGNNSTSITGTSAQAELCTPNLSVRTYN